MDHVVNTLFLLYNNEILKINCNNQTIERVQQYKLLGVIIDENFELYTHVRNIFKNGYSPLKILETLKWYTSYQSRKHLVKSLILSKIDYCNNLFYIKDYRNTKYNTNCRLKLVINWRKNRLCAHETCF